MASSSAVTLHRDSQFLSVHLSKGPTGALKSASILSIIHSKDTPGTIIIQGPGTTLWWDSCVPAWKHRQALTCYCDLLYHLDLTALCGMSCLYSRCYVTFHWWSYMSALTQSSPCFTLAGCVARTSKDYGETVSLAHSTTWSGDMAAIRPHPYKDGWLLALTRRPGCSVRQWHTQTSWPVSVIHDNTVVV